MRSHIRRLLESAGFSPKQLFAALQGAWLEPKQGLIWQENTGVTPTTTGGQKIGLMLDQSQGAVTGPELVTNGDFSSDTWWVKDAGCTISGGLMNFSSVVNGAGFYKGGIVAAGNVYIFSLTVSSLTAGGLKIYYGSTQLTSTITQNGSYSFVLPITSSSNIGALASGTTTCSVDNFSVRQVLGNHAYQATASARPTLQFNGALPLARFDSNDSLSLSLPNLGGGVFSNAGSVYFSTPVGMSQLNNQSMGTTYTLPALSSDIYSWMVFPQRLSGVQESRLALYMQQKAGIAGPDYLLDTADGQLTDDAGDLIFTAQ